MDPIEHRRDDGELIGWIRPVGGAFVAVDVLGRYRTGPVDWLRAEKTLDELGLGYLADPWTLELDGRRVRVRIVEVGRDGITVKKDDWGAIDVPQLTWQLPFPAPDELTHGTDPT